jgi:hypothetical protein
MSILIILFSWPNGIVVGNLIASCIWGGIAVFHLDRLARKHHKEHMRVINAAHNKRHEDTQSDA